MTRVAVITDDGVGGTFLSWSLHWLSGQQKYFHVPQNTHVEICHNPIVKNLNSHGFKINHVGTVSEIQNYLNKLPKTPLQHIYIHTIRSIDSCYSHSKKATQTKLAIDLVASHCDKVVVVKHPKKYALYHCKLQRRTNEHLNLFDGSFYQTNNHAEVLDEFIKFFFNESYELWLAQNLTDQWDKREFLALNLRPFDINYIENFHDFSFDHFSLSADLSWKSLDKYILDILDYCGIKLDPSKFDHWLEVFFQWQTLHRDRILFCDSFDNIIDAILTGKNIDLTTYNLDIVREAAIQHELIYKHNLNLKTWQLEKFTNTQQLHNLLEPNIHPVSL